MRSILVLMLLATALGSACQVNERSGEPTSANPRSAIADPADWCAEHGLPESKCTKCNPSLIPQFQQAGDWCAEHGFPESVCPLCNPMQPPTGIAQPMVIPGMKVRFRSPDIEQAVGIATVAAQRATVVAKVDCTARIAFDLNRLADVRVVIPGVVRRVRVDLGQTVRRGTPLFDLESKGIGEIQATLQAARERGRTARANLERQRDLLESNFASERKVELATQELAAAEAEARAASATLRIAGADQETLSGSFVVTAPIDGTVVRRPAVVGLLATEELSLATIADTSMMWALCDVPEQSVSRLQLGQIAHITLDGSAEDIFDGKITWISAEVDPRTRTVAARAEIPNPDGRLRSNQFARASIETATEDSAVAVPVSAVQRVGDQSVVFIRTEPGVYEPRVVTLELPTGELIQVEGDVHVGDLVVTTGAFLLKTELMPGNIGAGCCEVEPPGGR